MSDHDIKIPFLRRLRLAIAILLSSQALGMLIKDIERAARVQGAVEYVENTNRRQRRTVAQRRRRSAKPRRR
jgi:hypothetical protein